MFFLDKKKVDISECPKKKTDGSNNAPLMVDISDIRDSCWWGTTDFRSVRSLSLFLSLSLSIPIHVNT